jgi:hypothetical protein
MFIDRVYTRIYNMYSAGTKSSIFPSLGAKLPGASSDRGTLYQFILRKGDWDLDSSTTIG